MQASIQKSTIPKMSYEKRASKSVPPRPAKESNICSKQSANCNFRNNLTEGHSHSANFDGYNSDDSDDEQKSSITKQES